MKNKIIIGNWKLNQDIENIEGFMNKFTKERNTLEKETFFSFAMPSYYIGYLVGKGYDLPIYSLQYFNTDKNGSLTGQISLSQMHSKNISAILLGHSETREHLKESDKEINLKVKKLMDFPAKPVIIIGEKKNSDSINKENELSLQMTNIFKDTPKEIVDKSIIAYEPIWSVGSGVLPSNNEIEKTSRFIKKWLKNKYGDLSTKVIYGGSINEENYKEIKKIKGLDGYLLGFPSTKIDFLLKMVK